MSGREKEPSGIVTNHTVEDHEYGMMLDHVHGPDADHDHDTFDLGPLDENPIWLQDNVFLTSVGIDIGSSGTQIIFSRLQMRRISEDLTSRYIVTARETVYESPVALTPYRDEFRIDERALGAIIDDAYAAAHMTPNDVDTGVVILTGEALRRENSQAISDVVARQGGEFVCATAGHHMEAMLAAYGSGAARASYEQEARLLNVDIGGGTTKLAIIERGKIVQTAALHIGGRLLVADPEGEITRLDPAGRHHAARSGFDWQINSRVTDSELDAVAQDMADLFVSMLAGNAPTSEAEQLWLTDPIADFGAIDGVRVSGGVGEYVYGKEDRDFGDLGLRLGKALRARLGNLPYPLLPAGACIRATALGASEYTVQLSGNTSHVTNRAKLLPRRNLQVVHPEVDLPEVVIAGKVSAAIKSHLVSFDLVDSDSDIALALHWSGQPDHARLHAFATGICQGLDDRIAKGLPIILVLDADIARTIGLILQNELKAPVEILALDSLELKDFDYIDLGKMRLPSGTVPVTIKSLVFNDTTSDMRRHERIHHHPHDHAHHSHDGHHHHHHHGTHTHSDAD